MFETSNHDSKIIDVTYADFLETNIQALILFLNDPTLFLTEEQRLQNVYRLKGLMALRPLYDEGTNMVERNAFPGYPIATITDHSQK